MLRREMRAGVPEEPASHRIPGVFGIQRGAGPVNLLGNEA
jgi:hypothetical protein